MNMNYWGLRAPQVSFESVAKIINLHFYIIDKISISFLYKDADMKARYHDYCTEQTFFIQINPAEIRNNNPLVAQLMILLKTTYHWKSFQRSAVIQLRVHLPCMQG